MSRHKEKIIWIIWGFVFLAVFAYLAQAQTFKMLTTVDSIAFLALAMLTAILPIQYRNHTLTFFQWITLAIFIKYGFNLEVLISQMAVLAALIASGLTKQTLYRIPINSLIFLITSIVSASMFYLVGGQTGDLFSMLYHGHAMLVYAMCILVLNHVLIFATRRYLFSIKGQNFFKALTREMISATILLPIVILLIILHKEIGSFAVLFTGIAFIGISIVFKLYNRVEKVNHLLKEVTKFGYELNSSSTVEELMDKVRNHLKQFVDWDQLYFYNVKNKSLTLAYMDQRGNEAIPLILKYGDGISLQTALDETITLENERSYWSLRGKSLPDDLETILALPIKDQEAVKGVLTIASTKQKAYRTDQIMIIEIIANMLAIALTNVQYLEKTKRESHFCPLTNLYNFRFFEQALKDNLEETKQTSLILLDLDHFKKINDTYGHQSGNDVLIEIASRLTQTCPNEVVARYGGEEFVILLPNQTEEEAYQTGLKVQKALKQDPIIIQNDLTDHKPAEINVTASIGIASTEQVNEDDETTLDAVTLIRRADRAMYNGAKQQGRDKVASFNGLRQTKL